MVLRGAFLTVVMKPPPLVFSTAVRAGGGVRTIRFFAYAQNDRKDVQNGRMVSC